jgi:hypothetical protein
MTIKSIYFQNIIDRDELCTSRKKYECMYRVNTLYNKIFKGNTEKQKEVINDYNNVMDYLNNL